MLRSCNVVFVGSYNPAIFSPAWVRNSKLISVDDGSEPSINLIHPDISDFELSDVQITVERNRFRLSSKVYGIEILVGISQVLFNDLLPQTPNSAVGVNFSEHIDFGSFADRNKVGRILAPIGPWGAWAENFDNPDFRLNGGMSSLSMKKSYSVDPDIFTVFTIQPSAPENLRETHVYFGSNNHFAVAKKALDEGDHRKVNEWLLLNLTERFAAYETEFDMVIEQIRGLRNG